MAYMTDKFTMGPDEPPAEGQMVMDGCVVKKAMSSETLIFLGVCAAFFGVLAVLMGGVNLINTVISTSYDLLLNTAFYIMAIAVLAGAASELLTEFGVVSAANKLLSPLIRPIWGMPGSSTIGMFTTYLSDNPAIIIFGQNKSIRRYFKRYQLPALVNLGTAFGMGLIVTAFCAGLTSPTGETFLAAVVIGNIGAIVGSVVSTRLMLIFTARAYGKTAECDVEGVPDDDFDIVNFRKTRSGGFGSRMMMSALEGGAAGVRLSLAIIPGILIITTLVTLLTRSPSEAGVYTGAAYEGIRLLPYLVEKIDFILNPMFGLSAPEGIVVPITAIGSAGSAISLIPGLLQSGLANAHDVCVFMAICMCYSGYLCSHVVMMNELGAPKLSGKAILSHTIGGIAAGVAANLIYLSFVG